MDALYEIHIVIYPVFLFQLYQFYLDFKSGIGCKIKNNRIKCRDNPWRKTIGTNKELVCRSRVGLSLYIYRLKISPDFFPIIV